MVICLPVRSSATLDFMMGQAENRSGGIVLRSRLTTCGNVVTAGLSDWEGCL